MNKFILITVAFLIGSVLYASTGKHLYKKECASCHGKHGEKKALGSSHPIHGMPHHKTIKHMHQYAEGKRKSSSLVKGVKRKFIRKHSKKELESVAHYIETMK